MVQGAKLGLLVVAKKFDDAKGVAEGLVAASEKKKRATPADSVLMLANKKANPDKKHIDVAVKAADLVAKHAEDDFRMLLQATEVYAAAGQKDKATAAGQKAMAAAPNDKVKEQIGKLVDKILEGK